MLLSKATYNHTPVTGSNAGLSVLLKDTSTWAGIDQYRINTLIKTAINQYLAFAFKRVQSNTKRQGMMI